MKKTLFALIALTWVAQTTQAQSLSCSQKNTVAVDKYGTCTVYSNPCQVPSDWRILPATSCDDVEEASTTNSRQETVKSRIERMLAARSQKAEENEDTSVRTSYSRSGRGFYTRRNTTNYEEQDSNVSQTQKRTFSESLGSFNVKQRAYGELRAERSDDSATEYEKEGLTRPRTITSAAAVRTGKLANEPSFEERKANNYTGYRSRATRSPYWRSFAQIREDEKVTEEYTPRTITLRRTYRETSEGSLDNITNRNLEVETEAEVEAETESTDE